MISYKSYDIIYDITFFVLVTMISCSISQKPTFLAFLAPIIIDITHDNIAEIMQKGYDIKNFWSQWYLSYCFAYDMAW